MTDAGISRKFEEIEKRLSALEKQVFSKNSDSEGVSDYKGLRGGIDFLMDQGFFNEPRSLNEVVNELQREGYHYRKEAISTSLIRDFTKRYKKLVRTKADDLWKYALRK